MRTSPRPPDTSRCRVPPGRCARWPWPPFDPAPPCLTRPATGTRRLRRRYLYGRARSTQRLLSPAVKRGAAHRRHRYCEATHDVGGRYRPWQPGGKPMVDPVTPGPGREPRPRPLLRTALGDVLRRTRREQGRSLDDVAREAKVSMPYLSELERGRKEASSEIVAAVCEALGVDIADVLVEVRRDLVEKHAQTARVIRLDTARTTSVRRRGSGDVHCLAA